MFNLNVHCPKSYTHNMLFIGSDGNFEKYGCVTCKIYVYKPNYSQKKTNTAHDEGMMLGAEFYGTIPDFQPDIDDDEIQLENLCNEMVKYYAQS